MDFSVDAVAGKMVAVIIAISAIMMVSGFIIFASLAGNDDASVLLGMILGVIASTVEVADGIPFAVGIFAVMCLNIAKVLLMKRAVNNSLERETGQAKLYLQGQYFTRLVLTAAVLFVAGWLHSERLNDAGNPQYVNFMGAFFGIFSFPLAIYSMRFFLRKELKENALPESSGKGKSVVASAIEELKAIGNTETEESEKP